jgi:hypothetical protein
LSGLLAFFCELLLLSGDFNPPIRQCAWQTAAAGIPSRGVKLLDGPDITDDAPGQHFEMGFLSRAAATVEGVARRSHEALAITEPAGDRPIYCATSAFMRLVHRRCRQGFSVIMVHDLAAACDPLHGPVPASNVAITPSSWSSNASRVPVTRHRATAGNAFSNACSCSIPCRHICSVVAM